MSVNDTDLREGRINDQLGSQLESLSAQLEANVERGKNAWAEWRTHFGEQSREAMTRANEYARRNPWPLVCAAAVLGLLAGAVASLRGK